MRKLSLLLLALCVCSCSVLNSKQFVNVPDYHPYLYDELFFVSGSIPSIENVELLALPRPTKNYLDQYVIGLKTEQERYEALRQWVFDRFSSYQYDASETLSIANLVNSRKINCLSFSALFVAAARYVNLPANFQLVYAPPYWDGSSDTWTINQHVNVYGDIEVAVTSMVVATDFNWYLDGKDNIHTPWGGAGISKRKTKQRYVADINRAVVSVPFQTRTLNDDQLLALFYNNKASEAIQNNDLALAYAYIKVALEADASLSSVWNGLGVLYQKLNQYELAKEVYLRAINLNDDTYTAKSNLANVYLLLDDSTSAVALDREINSYREANPYYHFSLGERSVANNQLEEAVRHFDRAVVLKHNEQLFYYALAKAQVKLGLYQQVAENLKNARIYAKGGEKARYSNKLKQFEQAIASFNNN